MNQDLADVFKWVSSHPGLKDRIEYVTKQLGDSTYEKPFDIDWKEFKELTKIN